MAMPGMPQLDILRRICDKAAKTGDIHVSGGATNTMTELTAARLGAAHLHRLDGTRAWLVI
jgi:hypothetical protein